jgi:hypothetical protein
MLGGESVAVVPGHALANAQRVLRRILVRFPAFEKDGCQAAVTLILDKVFQPAAANIGQFRPVPGARVTLRLDVHLHADRAALHRRLGARLRRGKAEQPVGRRRRKAQCGGACQELAAAQAACSAFFSIHPRCGVYRPRGIPFVLHRSLPVSDASFFCFPKGMRRRRYHRATVGAQRVNGYDMMTSKRDLLRIASRFRLARSIIARRATFEVISFLVVARLFAHLAGEGHRPVIGMRASASFVEVDAQTRRLGGAEHSPPRPG